MTRWYVSHADILDTEADGLICSANPSLNLSGGVGGAFLLQYGTGMQEILHSHLRSTGQRFIEPGRQFWRIPAVHRTRRLPMQSPSMAFTTPVATSSDRPMKTRSISWRKPHVERSRLHVWHAVTVVAKSRSSSKRSSRW